MYLQNLAEEFDDPRFEDAPVRDSNLVVRTDRVRVIQRPNDSMLQLQRRLMTELRGLGVRLPFATASLPGSSLKGNVLPHRHSRHLYLLDLAGAYGSVEVGRLAEVLGRVDPRLEGFQPETEAFLARYCFTDRGLAMGGPASQDLFNLYAGLLLDDPIGELVGSKGWVYTRYLDDLTISSPVAICEWDRRSIRKILDRSGFAVSHHKSKVLDLRVGPAVITGVGLEYGGRIFVPRHYLRHLCGLLHLAERGQVSPQVMAAKMGAFWAMTERPLNESEWRLVKAYWGYRNRLRNERRASA